MSIWRHFNRFLIKLDMRIATSWEEKVALFGAHLTENGLQSSTLKSYFSAIKYILKSDGYEWSDNKAVLNGLIKGCKMVNDQIKIRLPIRRKLLELMLFEVERLYDDQPYLEYMYKAAFVLAYFAMLRVGEIGLGDHTVLAPNVHVSMNNDRSKILVVLYTSKTHGEDSDLQRITVSPHDGPCSAKAHSAFFFCPVQIVNRYMAIKGGFSNKEEKFITYHDHSPVQPEQLRKILRLLLDNLRLQSEYYDMHSFRSGKSVDMFHEGYSLSQIKMAGRWQSNVVYKYLKL